MSTKSVSLFEPKILVPALGETFSKLDPRLMIKNPVMFVTMVGAIISTVEIFRSPGQTLFVTQIAIWLWFTVLFANFAEAIAEGRGKAQAKALRQTRTRTSANKISGNDKIETVDAGSLRKGDIVLVRTNEIIPADGVIELNADLAAITLKVANTGDRPIQVGSHYHFFETNPALAFDRTKARGFRLDIPAGTAVRFEPGQSRDVHLVPFRGKREVFGFRQDVMGTL